MLNHPEATEQALQILRSGASFQWYVIPMLAFVVYVYFNEIAKKNWKAVAAGLSLYMVHWFFEILNALIQHFSGHALWTVPTGTAFLLLVGVGRGAEPDVFHLGPDLQQGPARRPEDEDTRRQQPALHRGGERGLLSRCSRYSWRARPRSCGSIPGGARSRSSSRSTSPSGSCRCTAMTGAPGRRRSLSVRSSG